MSQGLKAGDNKIGVMPGALQADTPDFPPNGDNIFWNAKYAGNFYTYFYFVICYIFFLFFFLIYF